MEYQRIKVFWHGPCGGVLVLVRQLFLGVVGNVSGVLVVGVVFGALLGPEATGPFCSNAFETVLVFLLFLLPVPLCPVGCGGLVDGVVV